MAITPNTDFSAGAVLTASQQNRFPRGIMAQNTTTTGVALNTTETAQITTGSFTAVANRWYKITYFEPNVQYAGGAGNYIEMRIRLTNATGTAYSYSQWQSPGATQTANFMITSVITTLSAGSTTFCGTLKLNTGAGNAFRGAGSGAYILVEDMGGA